MILETYEESVTYPYAQFTHRAALSTNAPRVTESEPFVVFVAFDTEVRSENLQPCADREHARPVADPFNE
jgi:hypothetical protein